MSFDPLNGQASYPLKKIIFLNCSIILCIKICKKYDFWNIWFFKFLHPNK